MFGLRPKQTPIEDPRDATIAAALDDALQARNDRRYEEELEAIYRALRFDPGNLALRLSLAQAQETLGLYLDALLTYHSAKDLTRETRHEQIARFRWTLVLGTGAELASQWLPALEPLHETRRTAELQRIRDRLSPVLNARFSTIPVSLYDREILGIEDGESSVVRVLMERDRVSGRMAGREEVTALRRIQLRRLHLVFQHFALDEAKRLARAWEESGDDDGPTSAASPLLIVRAELRARHARRLLAMEISRVASRFPGLATAPSAEPPGDAVRWPPTLQAVEQLWSDSQENRRAPKDLSSSRRYEDHLMAARMYAVGLLPQSRGRSDAAGISALELSTAAVRELTLAARGVNLAEAGRWDAVASQDPDLAGLRSQPAFQAFEADAFPTPVPPPLRPSGIAALEASRHSQRMIEAFSTQMQMIWRSRADMVGSLEIADAELWLNEEGAAWTMMRELVVHHRHWQTRLAVGRFMQNLAERHSLPAQTLSRPRYSSAPFAGTVAEVEHAARREIGVAAAAFSRLARALDAPVAAEVREWRRHLDELGGRGARFSAVDRRQLASSRMSRWVMIDQTLLEVQVERSREDPDDPLDPLRVFGDVVDPIALPSDTTTDSGPERTPPRLDDRRSAVLLGAVLTTVFVVALILSWSSSPPKEIPGVALGSPMLLRLEHAAVATALIGTFGLVLIRGFAGHWPLEIGTGGLKYAATVEELTAIEQDIGLLREVAEEHDRRLGDGGGQV